MFLRFGSLRTRMVLFTTIPLIVVLAALLFVAHRTADESVQRSVRHSLADAGSVLGELLAGQQRELMNMARVVADDPRFFVTFSIPEEERGIEFEPTVAGVMEDFLRITDADLIEVIDPAGTFHLLTQRGHATVSMEEVAGAHGVHEAGRGQPAHDFYRWGGRCVVAAVVPVYVAGELAAILRTGNILDGAFVADVRRLTGAEIALADQEGGFADTFPAAIQGEQWPASSPANYRGVERFQSSEATVFERGGRQYLGIELSFRGADRDHMFGVHLGRALDTELASLRAMEARMAGLGLLALILTIGAGYVAASTVTKPLSQVVRAAVDLEQGKYDTPLELIGRDEVAILSRCFTQMRVTLQSNLQHLQDIDKMKSDFIAVAGHELKTPLTVITSFNDLIASGGMGDLPDDVQEMSTIIKDQLTGLNRLVQNILDLSALEQGLDSLMCEEIDPVELVRNVMSDHAADRSQREIMVVERYNLDAGAAVIHADEHRIQQALRSILDNAVRFTPDGGTITVSVSGADEELRIAVRDTGIGIPAQELEWIFDKGYEVGDVMRHKSGRLEFGSKGFGLGLALGRTIMEHHHGRIEVTSVLGQGSEFTLILPARLTTRELLPA